MWRIPRQIGVLVAVFMLTVSPAFAQSIPPSLNADASANWAGYVASGNGTYSAVSGTWVVPTPSSDAARDAAADATWVGIGGTSSHDLIQAGTQAVVQNGGVTYQAWYEILPQDQQLISLPVHGGDSVSVSLSETSTNLWQLTFVNNTTGQQYQTTINYASSHSSAEWIEEMPIGGSGRILSYIPLDNFGTAQFTSAYTVVNGTNESLATAGAQPITMVAGNQVIASPAAINSDGASFSIARSDVSLSTQRYAFAQGGRGGYGRVGVGMRGFTRGMRTRGFSIPTMFIIQFR